MKTVGALLLASPSPPPSAIPSPPLVRHRHGCFQGLATRGVRRRRPVRWPQRLVWHPVFGNGSLEILSDAERLATGYFFGRTDTSPTAVKAAWHNTPRASSTNREFALPIRK